MNKNKKSRLLTKEEQLILNKGLLSVQLFLNKLKAWQQRPIRDCYIN